MISAVQQLNAAAGGGGREGEQRGKEGWQGTGTQQKLVSRGLM